MVAASSLPPPNAAPRRSAWHRPAGRVAMVVGALLALLLACELIGWRFLKDPVESRLSQALGVPVAISAPFDLHLLRPPQLAVGHIRIDALPESGAPFFVDARDALLQWRWSDLWAFHRGQALRIKRLEVNTLEAHALRPDARYASWNFPLAPSAAGQPGLPQFDVLRLRQGEVHVDDRVTQLQLEVQVRLNERARADGLPSTPWRLAKSSGPYDDLSFGFDTPRAEAADTSPLTVRNALLMVAAADEAGFSLDARGSYRDLPVNFVLRAPKLMPLLANDAESTPLMVTTRASVGETHMSYDGASVDLSGRGLAGDFTLNGPSLAAVGSIFGVTLPTTGAFELHGHLSRPEAAWQARIDEAKIGSSQLAGTFVYDPAQAVPNLSGRLTGSRLALADLGPAVGTRAKPAPPLPVVKPAPSRKARPAAAAPSKPASSLPAADRRVLPDRGFDLPSLRAMNAQVDVALDEFDLNTSFLEPLHPLRVQIRLKDGVLNLDQLEADVAGGFFAGSTSLDGNVDPARWQADMTWKGIDLAGWLSGARKSRSTVNSRTDPDQLAQQRRQARAGQGRPRSYLTGQLQGAMKLTGYGNSTAQILGSAEGQLETVIRDGAISHHAVEVMGLDVAQALGLLAKGDSSLPLSCAVVAVDAQQGVLRPRVAVLDTRDSTVIFNGSINLASEQLDLTGSVRPHDFTVLALRTPLKIRGSLGAPTVSLETAPLAGRVAAAAGLALVNPFAALLPFIDPGDKKTATGCQRLAAQAVASSGK